MRRRFPTALTGFPVVIVAAQVLCLGLACTSAAAEPAETWPQWRGPTRDGFVTGPDWPTSVGEDHLKLLWQV